MYVATVDIRPAAGGAEQELHDQIADAIRARVRVMPGPGARRLAQKAMPFQLSYAEADQAADAVMEFIRGLAVAG